MSLRVVEVGPQATVQDRGRTGFRAFGVPPGGAFDLESSGLANALLGNPRTDAVVEISLRGGVFQAESSLDLALAGAPFEVMIERPDGTIARLVLPQSFRLEAGDRLMIGGTPLWVRGYLAVRGGWQTRLVLGSRSSETTIVPGDRLPATTSTGRFLVRRLRPTIETPGPLRILAGPEATASLNTSGKDLSFRVGSRSNRIGLRLEGPAPTPLRPDGRRSAPVAPGAIQATGEGLIILGVACGTMGGYPQLGQVISADLDRLARLRPGDEVRFEPIDLASARWLDRERRELLADRERVVATLASDRTALPDAGI